MRNILLVIFVFNSYVIAQNGGFSILLMAGNASDNDALGNFGGGGASYQHWESGPIFTLGIERELSESFSAQGFLSYSYYNYNGRSTFGEKTNTGANKLFDILGRIKWNIGIFYIFGGAGISSQHGDAINYFESNEYHEATVAIPEKSSTVFAGTLGLGFDIYIYKNFSLLAEGDWFFREYLGSAWQIGTKYTF